MMTSALRAVFAKDEAVLTDAQREALGALADCFADDGIVVDAENIRAALASLRSAESRAKAAESEIGRLRAQLDESRRRVQTLEAASVADGWRMRAEAGEIEVQRLTKERNEARAAVQEILASLREQGEAADAAEASVAGLRLRIEELEQGLRDAAEAMRACRALTASRERVAQAEEAERAAGDATGGGRSKPQAVAAPPRKGRAGRGPDTTPLSGSSR